MGVKKPKEMAAVLAEQGIESREDFSKLDDDLRKELDDVLKTAGISIGDRAKMKQAKVEAKEVSVDIGNAKVNVPQLVPGQAMQVSTKLERVFLGMGWTGKAADKNVDVDASVVAFSGGKVADLIFFKKLRNESKSCVHTGDVLTGADPSKQKDLQDMERIYCWLSNLPKHIDCLVFVANIYTEGVSFSELQSAYIRMVNADTNQELCRVPLSGGGLKGNCLVFCKLYRTPPVQGQPNAPWQVLGLGMPTSVGGMTSVEEMIPMLQKTGTAHPPQPVVPFKPGQPGNPGVPPPGTPANPATGQPGNPAKPQKPRSVLPCVALAVAGTVGIAAATAIFMNSDLSEDMFNSSLFTDGVDFAGDALEFGGDALVGAGEIIGDAAGEVYGWAAGVVEDVPIFEDIGDGLAAAADWSGDALSFAAEGVGDFAGGIADSDAMAAVADGAGDFFDGAGDFAGDAAGAVGDFVTGDAVGGVVDGAGDFAGDAFGAMGDFGGDVMGGDAMGQVGEAFGDAGGFMGDGFEAGAGAIGGAVQNVDVGGMAEQVGGLLSSFGGMFGD
jgi:tellurium resistance protein TerZ